MPTLLVRRLMKAVAAALQQRAPTVGDDRNMVEAEVARGIQVQVLAQEGGAAEPRSRSFPVKERLVTHRPTIRMAATAETEADLERAMVAQVVIPVAEVAEVARKPEAPLVVTGHQATQR